MQPVGLHHFLNEVGRQQTAHLHLHTHSVQHGSQVGHQAALLHLQLALEGEDLLGPQPAAGGHPFPSSPRLPLLAGHTSLDMELTLAIMKSQTVATLNKKKIVSIFSKNEVYFSVHSL